MQFSEVEFVNCYYDGRRENIEKRRNGMEISRFISLKEVRRHWKGDEYNYILACRRIEAMNGKKYIT